MASPRRCPATPMSPSRCHVIRIILRRPLYTTPRDPRCGAGRRSGLSPRGLGDFLSATAKPGNKRRICATAYSAVRLQLLVTVGVRILQLQSAASYNSYTIRVVEFLQSLAASLQICQGLLLNWLYCGSYCHFDTLLHSLQRVHTDKLCQVFDYGFCES